MTDAPTPRDVIAEAWYTSMLHSSGPNAADAILSALTAAGYVVVPREPTLAMRRVAIEKKRRNRAFPETWRAVVDAAPRGDAP